MVRAAPAVSAGTPSDAARGRNADARRSGRSLELIADLESDGKGVPILVKQYLKTGGRLLACNVDRHFADALDALIVVDLRSAPAPAAGEISGQARRPILYGMAFGYAGARLEAGGCVGVAARRDAVRGAKRGRKINRSRPLEAGTGDCRS
ncbi:MAG: hypothetical protein WDO73_07370, partial [Ignavibacteriota bacterium]